MLYELFKYAIKILTVNYVEPNKMFIGECVWAPRGGTMSCETIALYSE